MCIILEGNSRLCGIFRLPTRVTVALPCKQSNLISPAKKEPRNTQPHFKNFTRHLYAHLPPILTLFCLNRGCNKLEPDYIIFDSYRTNIDTRFTAHLPSHRLNGDSFTHPNGVESICSYPKTCLTKCI